VCFGQNLHSVLKKYGNSKWKEIKYLSRILWKAKYFIICAVLCVKLSFMIKKFMK